MSHEEQGVDRAGVVMDCGHEPALVTGDVKDRHRFATGDFHGIRMGIGPTNFFERVPIGSLGRRHPA